MKTKEKIIKESLDLFNENTFESSTTNLIAKSSGVLEGSLWYHFNSKHDLVSVHADLFLNSFNEQKIYTEKDIALEVLEGLLSVYEILWDYRYLMRDSFGQISDSNSNLFNKILEINTSIDEWVKETIIHSRSIGILIIEEDDIDNIVDISLIIGRHWLDYSRKKYPSESNMYLRKKGVNLLIKTLYPYLSNESKETMDSIYESN
jgi:AcrR family transcriptional regulator